MSDQDDLKVDDGSQTIFWQRRPVTAPPKVVALIGALLDHPGEVRTKQQLVEDVWHNDCSDDSAIWQTVYLARQVLKKHGIPAIIETFSHRGYRLSWLSAATNDGKPKAIQTAFKLRWAQFAAIGIVAIGVLGVFAAEQTNGHASPASRRLYAAGPYCQMHGGMASRMSSRSKTQ